MAVSVRPATHADSASIASLLSELGYAAGVDHVMQCLKQRRHQPNSTDLIAELNGEVAGFLSAESLFYFPEGKQLCRVTALVVTARYRRQGAGRALLDAAAKFARSRDCDSMEITVAERRTDSHRFYERMGFSRTSYRFLRTL